MQRELVSFTEAGRRLGVSRDTLRGWVKAGKLGPVYPSPRDRREKLLDLRFVLKFKAEREAKVIRVEIDEPHQAGLFDED